MKNRIDFFFINFYYSFDWFIFLYNYSNKIFLYCDSYYCFDKGKFDICLYLIKDIKLFYKNFNIIVDDKIVFVIFIFIIVFFI